MYGSIGFAGGHDVLTETLPNPPEQVYMAKWHELLVAVKILLSASGEDMTEEGMKQALTLSNPVLENLHKEVGVWRGEGEPARGGGCGAA